MGIFVEMRRAAVNAGKRDQNTALPSLFGNYTSLKSQTFFFEEDL
jgi:hypothetical protein